MTRFSFIGLYSGSLDAFDEHCFEMKRSVRKKLDDSFELKKSSRPVNGMNSYSVFQNDRLVFMMDGDAVPVGTVLSVASLCESVSFGAERTFPFGSSS